MVQLLFKSIKQITYKKIVFREFTLNSLLLFLTLLNIRFYAITAMLDECNQNLEIGKLLSFELIKSLMRYCQPEN